MHQQRRRRADIDSQVRRVELQRRGPDVGGQQLPRRSRMRGRAGGGDDRVHQHGEIRARRGVVDGIDAWIANRRLADVARHRVSAGRETDDADAVGVRGPVRATRTAQQAHRALDVVDGHVRACRPAVGRQAVTQHRAFEPALREPLRRLEALLVDDHAFITTARHDEQRDAIGIRLRPEPGERGARDVLGVPVAQRPVGRPLDEGLAHRDPFSAGCAAGPERRRVAGGFGGGDGGEAGGDVHDHQQREHGPGRGRGAIHVRQYAAGHEKRDRSSDLSPVPEPPRRGHRAAVHFLTTQYLKRAPRKYWRPWKW